MNHNAYKISYLIDEIIKYAKENNFRFIRGPINIPVIIFGFGFMKEGSSESLFIGKPVNPPIYQEIFLSKRFYVKFEENTWVGSPLLRFNPWKIKKYDFKDYEYFNPKDFDDFMKYKYDFLKIHAKNLPLSSRITPNIENLFENYGKFIFKYGYNFMVFLVKYRTTGKIVACGAYLPNPFRKDNKGNYDSCVVYTWAVEPEHRRKGLVLLMYGATSLLLWKKKIKYGAGPIGSDNKNNIEVAKRLAGKIDRTHLILEYKV